MEINKQYFTLTNLDPASKGNLGKIVMLWAPVLYLLLTTTKLFFFWKETASTFEQNQEAGDTLVSTIGIVILILLLPQLYRKKNEVLQILGSTWPLVLLFIFSLLSCTWSEVPFMAFRRWLKIVITFLCILNCATEDTTGESLKKCIYTYIVTTISLSLLFIFLLPQYGWRVYDGYQLPCGIMRHKNSLGQLAGIAVLVLTSFGFKKKSNIILITIALFLLVISKSMASLGGFLISMSIITCYAVAGQLRIVKLFIALLFFISFYFLLFLIMNDWNIISNIIASTVSTTGKELTFTGRSDMWNVLFNIGIETHPILGVGFGSFFIGEKSNWLLPYLGWSAPDAHNGFLMVFLELGLAGIVLAFFCLLFTLVTLVRNKKLSSTERVALFGIFIFLLFNNIFEAGMLSTTLIFAIFDYLCVYNSQRSINWSTGA